MGFSHFKANPSKTRRILASSNPMENITYKPAYIYKGKNEWYVRYSYLHPDTATFKEFTERGGLNRIKVLREKEKAAIALRDMINNMLRNGWNPFDDENVAKKKEPASVGLIAYLETLIETKRQTLKRRTWQSYVYGLNCLKKWLIAQNLQNIAISKFTDDKARQFHDSLLLAGTYKNKSINNQVANLKVIFNLALERKAITANPFKGINKLPEESGKHFPYSKTQKTKMKKAILKDDPELWMFVKVIYHCFIRPVEILRLKVGDVDVKNRLINLPAGITKNKKQLSVVIPANFIDEVKQWQLHKYDENWYLFSHDLKPGPKTYGRNNVSRRHSEIRKDVGLDDRYDLYSWKHTGNVDSYRAGVPVVDIMRQNRHASLDETMNYLRSLGLLPNIEYSKKAPKL